MEIDMQSVQGAQMEVTEFHKNENGYQGKQNIANNGLDDIYFF